MSLDLSKFHGALASLLPAFQRVAQNPEVRASAEHAFQAIWAKILEHKNDPVAIAKLATEGQAAAPTMAAAVADTSAPKRA